jgi:formylglycine-generating enzyme required for sulfatase activity
MGEKVDLHIGGYHLTESIGTGGMGSVFRATVEADGKPTSKGTAVAVKLLHPHLRTVAEFVKRFHREAKLAATIDHPNVVRVLDEGVHDGRHHYIVMELAEGLKLTDLIGDRQPLSPQQTIEVMNQTCEALRAAGSVADPDEPGRVRSLVHRDIKPDNIIIQPLDRKQFDTMTRTGDKTALANIRVKLLDFGLAKDVKALSTILSQTGQSLGTPAYMSPEQCKGDDVDQRSDVYSLGVVAHHMITGTQPFAGPTTVAYATQHAEEIPPDILKRNPLCPKNLADCIYRCLAKDPRDRYGSPAELQADLARVAAGQGVAKVYRFRKKGSFSTKKVAAIAGAGVLACLLAVAAISYFTGDAAKGALTDAIQKADVAIAAQDYAGAKRILEQAVAAFPGRSDKAELTAPAHDRLKTIAAKAAEQEQAKAKADEERRIAAQKAEAELKQKEREAAEATAKAKHEQDAIAAVAAIKAKTAAGDYQKAIDAANAAIRDFSDTPSGKDLPDLLADATGKLKGAQEAAAAKEAAEAARQAAEAKARHERFIKYRDEGDAAFGAAAPNYTAARTAYEKALAEEPDPQVQSRLQTCIDRTTKQPLAVVDFEEKGDVAAALGVKDAGQTVADLVLSRFGQDRYQLVNRSDLQTILAQLDLQMAQLRDKPDLAYGKFKDIRYLVVGRVSRLGNIIVTAQLVDIGRPGVKAGGIVQTAEVSAENARGVQDALTELVKILQMTDAEKKAYLDQAQYPQLLSDARAKRQAKDYAAAIALYTRVLAIRSTVDVQDELKACQGEQAQWEGLQAAQREKERQFAQLMATADAALTALPADKTRLTTAHRSAAADGLKAIDAALLLKPGDAGATALRTALAAYLGAEKELTLDLGNKVTMKLALIPSGKFQMGSPDNEKDRSSDEGPQREVTISKPFYMGVYEVTKDQFGQFIADSGHKTDAEKEGWAYAWEGSKWDKVNGASWKKPGFTQADDHPVTEVSHNDAIEFCKWLGKKTGKSVSLPTEAQWEYAARGGTKTAYPWGDDPDDGKGWANAADQSAKKQFSGWTCFSWDDGYVFTAPVGKFKANAFGLHDMIGNVWEWCDDWYDAKYYANANKTDPTGPASGAHRVLRGGSWLNSPRDCRSAYRSRHDPGLRPNYIGFRVVVDLE